MPNSIYDQMGAALTQASRQGQRSILYRGKVIECVVLIGNSTTALQLGGLGENKTIHVQVLRSLIPIGPQGDPHTNEQVTYPAVPVDGLLPKVYRVDDVIGQEWAWSFTLTDPTK